MSHSGCDEMMQMEKRAVLGRGADGGGDRAWPGALGLFCGESPQGQAKASCLGFALRYSVADGGSVGRGTRDLSIHVYAFCNCL